jgi:hypothetical protein
VKPLASQTSSTPARQTPPIQNPLAAPPPDDQAQKQPPPSQAPPPAARADAGTESAAPQTFSSVMLEGDMAFQEGNNQKAYAHYLKAYRMNPGSREVKRKLVMILTLLNKPQEALKYK